MVGVTLWLVTLIYIYMCIVYVLCICYIRCNFLYTDGIGRIHKIFAGGFVVFFKLLILNEGSVLKFGICLMRLLHFPGA